MEYQELSYETRGNVGIITLDRPQARNALVARSYQELGHVMQNTTARCVVVTGRDPAFCSGDDVKELLAPMGNDTEKSAASQAIEPRLTPTAAAFLYSNRPVIAAVNGAAVGWGMELALLADIRVASDRARFGELFVLRGICSDVLGIGRLAQLVGREKAAELLLTGDIIDADEALRIGLVSRVVPHAELMSRTLELATRIAENPPLAVAKLKEGLRRALDPDWEKLGEFVSTSLMDLFRTEDHREGVRAFLEKRAPEYKGR